MQYLENMINQNGYNIRTNKILDMIPIATRCADNFYLTYGGDHEEYFQEAMLVICENIDKFSNEKYSAIFNNLMRNYIIRRLNAIVKNKMLNEGLFDNSASVEDIDDIEDDIDIERLKVKPHARYCITCREIAEKTIIK